MSFIRGRGGDTPPQTHRSEVEGEEEDAGKIVEDKPSSFALKEDELSRGQYLARLSPYFAEFVGCMLQALAWNCTELGKESSKAGEWKPLVVGLMLMVSTYSFAGVSGAHLNPAVSITVGLSNKGDWFKIAKYIGVQILGSAMGIFLSCFTYGKTAAEAIGPRNGFSPRSCFLVELFYTGMVCLVYLNVMLSRANNSVKSGNQFYGMAIGFALAAGCWAVEDISGAIFNPALAISIDFQNVSNGVGFGMAYMIAEILGAFLAATLYRVMRPSEGVQTEEEFVASQNTKEDVTYPKVVAEGVGTFLVVFTFGMTTLSKLYKEERPFAAAAALMSMHYSIADLGGGHFNPAVTLSVMINGRGKCSIKQGIAFIVTQIISAALAGLLYTAIRWPHTFPAIPHEADAKYGAIQMSVIDMIFAFVVCYVALATMTIKGIKTKLQRNYFEGLAYGLSSASGGFALLHLLNSLANPAMTMGLSLAFLVAEGKGNWSSMTVAIFQFGGAVLASGLFRVTHAANFRRYNAGLKEEGEDTPLVNKKAGEEDP